MNETFALIFTIVVLAITVISLVLERANLMDQHNLKENKMLEEQSRLIKAIIAKNANDYVMTTSIDKVPAEDKPKLDPDLVPEEALSDEEFMHAINKDIKK